jgi:hypothetical protein
MEIVEFTSDGEAIHRTYGELEDRVNAAYILSLTDHLDRRDREVT